MNKPPLEPLPIAEQSNFRHELWLIYSQLRDAENDPVKRLTILERSRQELGMVLNEMNRPSTNFLNPTNHQPKSPRSQAANLNCRYRQKDLTPDSKVPCPISIGHFDIAFASTLRSLSIDPLSRY